MKRPRPHGSSIPLRIVEPISKLIAFARLSRPHFLLGGAVMFSLGGLSAPSIDAGLFALGLAMVLTGQLTAHYVNEYADAEVDRAVENRTLFSGGSGVLVEGNLSRKTALRAGVSTTVVTVALSMYLVALGLPGAALLGLAALVISWSYSIPPVRLLRTAVGEVAASAVVVVLVPWIGAVVQRGNFTVELAWAMVVLFPLHLAMMLAFEVPDLESDARSGKTVAAVRLGRTSTLRLIVTLDGIAAVSLLAALLAGGLPREATPALGFVAPAGTTLWGLWRRRYQLSSSSAVLAFGGGALGLTLALGAVV